MKPLVNMLLRVIIGVPILFTVMALFLFAPSNDFTWLEGWLFIIIFLGYIFLYMLYYLIKDPDTLVKRGKYITDDPNTKSFPDKTSLALLSLLFLFVLLFPGIDHGFTISPIIIPPEIEFIGFIGVIFSLIFITYVNQVNRYASKGLVIHKDHELITAGPYQHIRHPMYTGFIVMMIGMPIALGSFIAVIGACFFPLILVFRIRIEEKMLIDHLPGYKDYMEQVRYRLIPRIY
jgi:protein-S-isoprenylcysteine O-methyltransferase Ste14